ncbi:hypothetical protein F5887DRAFT_1288020, partial [Amanita rubescens]
MIPNSLPIPLTINWMTALVLLILRLLVKTLRTKICFPKNSRSLVSPLHLKPVWQGLGHTAYRCPPIVIVYSSPSRYTEQSTPSCSTPFAFKYTSLLRLLCGENIRMSWVEDAAIADRKTSKSSSGNGYMLSLLQPTSTHLLVIPTQITVKLDFHPNCLEVRPKPDVDRKTV